MNYPTDYNPHSITDSAYYRCRVTSVEDDSCSVHYVDYGNRETVAITALFDIPMSLTEHKICGFNCKIVGTKIPVSSYLQLFGISLVCDY